MKKLDINDWYVLRRVANNRLNPDSISAWFLATSLFSGLVLIIALYGLFKGVFLNKLFWTPIVIVLGVGFILQLLIFKYFSTFKNMYNKQKFQVVCLSIVGTKISIDGYLLFFMSADENMLLPSIINAAILALIGGLILIIISTIRGIHRAKNGFFREGKNGLYDFKNSKNYISFYGIYSLVIIINLIVKAVSMNGMIDYSLIIYLIILVILQYSISLAIPEFYLLTYCKFRYKEFNVAVPKKFQAAYDAEIKSK